MNCSPTLTVSEFSDVHNAKCQLHSILQSVEGNVHPRLAERLQKVMDLLNKGLASAYNQDANAYLTTVSHVSTVSKELGVKSVWAIHKVKDLWTPHPWPNHKIVSYSNHTGPSEVKVSINGTTWADLWVAADKAIRLSGDNRHIFIEDFTQSKTRDFELCLSTGS